MCERYPDCVSYEKCLTKAAMKDGRLCCEKCEKYQKREREEVLYIIPYCRLLYALFFNKARGNCAPKQRDGKAGGAYIKKRHRLPY